MGKDKDRDRVRDSSERSRHNRKPGSTITVPGRQTEGPKEYVTGLKVIDTGEIFHFVDLVRDGAPVQWFIVGRDPDCDVVLDDRTVTRTHCFIQWDGDTTLIRDYDSKNRTHVNSVPLVDGNAEILPGFIIELGSVELMACGGERVTRPYIVSRDKLSFASKVNRYYPSPRKAHEGTGIARTTLVRWVEEGDIKVIAR